MAVDEDALAPPPPLGGPVKNVCAPLVLPLPLLLLAVRDNAPRSPRLLMLMELLPPLVLLLLLLLVAVPEVAVVEDATKPLYGRKIMSECTINGGELLYCRQHNT